MIDYNVTATENYINSEIQATEEACCAEAIKNGYTPKQAEKCEAGDRGCKNCPFER